MGTYERKTDRPYTPRRHHRIPGIGARLRRLRRMAGLTGAELARRVELDVAMVSHWEAERSRLSLADALRVCDALGCTLDTLARGPVP